MIFNVRRQLHRSLVAGSAMLAALVLTSVDSFAQPSMQPMQVAELANELNLTPAQEPVFTAILENHIAETKALLERHGVDPSKGRPPMRVMWALRGEMEQNRKDLHMELATVLTPEQLEQLKAMTSQRPRR